jgi:hypothetical protein
MVKIQYFQVQIMKIRPSILQITRNKDSNEYLGCCLSHEPKQASILNGSVFRFLYILFKQSFPYLTW